MQLSTKFNFFVKNKNQILLIVSLILLGVVCRLLPHLANFTPIGAIALFAGFYWRGKWQLIVLLLIMLISDSIIGFYSIRVMVAVYVCIAFNAYLGRLIKPEKITSRIIPIALIGSSIFFIVTNFAVWSFSGWYPHTIPGLLNCYYLALPFFRNTIAGDLLYSSILFGAYAIVFAKHRNLSVNELRNFNYGSSQK
jgi:hypothetical protein